MFFFLHGFCAFFHWFVPFFRWFHLIFWLVFFTCCWVFFIFSMVCWSHARTFWKWLTNINTKGCQENGTNPRCLANFISLEFHNLQLFFCNVSLISFMFAWFYYVFCYAPLIFFDFIHFIHSFSLLFHWFSTIFHWYLPIFCCSFMCVDFLQVFIGVCTSSTAQGGGGSFKIGNL